MWSNKLTILILKLFHFGVNQCKITKYRECLKKFLGKILNMTISSIKVLVVDDEEMVRMNLEAFLEDAGFEILSAGCGAEAESLLQAKTVNIGIIDMRLPDIDGQTLILKVHKIYPEMQFIIHTGSLDYIIPQSLIEIGITDEQICNKPIRDMEELVTLLNKLASKPLS